MKTDDLYVWAGPLNVGGHWRGSVQVPALHLYAVCTHSAGDFVHGEAAARRCAEILLARMAEELGIGAPEAVFEAQPGASPGEMKSEHPTIGDLLERELR